MAQMLLINPAKRPSKRRAAAKKRPARARKTTARKTTARRVGYSPNPLPVSKVKRRVRRAVVKAKRSVRRRNPISMGKLNMRGITGMFKDALIGGAGAVSVDMLMAQVNKFLPASLQPTATPGANQAIKAGITAVLGVMLSKPTKGLSQKAAAGALAVQAADVVRFALTKYAPNMLPASPSVAGIGYASAARIIPGSARISPAIGMAARGSSTLSAFTQGGATLSGARMREGSVR